MSEVKQPLKISRRTLIGGTAAAAAAGTFGLANVRAEVEKLKEEGWEATPTACCMCGARCGMLVMKKKGEPVGPATVRVFPNPEHPQRGYCGRGAQTMWLWNHPMRIKKPLKRVGERGEGKFEEISWDQALDEIAAKLKEITEKHGRRSVVLTSHNFTAYQHWFAKPFGTPNVINHSSTCNSASTLARRMVFGPGHSGLGLVEPDYANARYLLLVGRTIHCAVGVHTTVAAARERGCKVVFVDPRMPQAAFADTTWIPIKPGTDAAFLHALIYVGLHENLVDMPWVRRWTNAAYLITGEGPDMKPVTEADLRTGGRPNYYAVVDESGEVRFQGVKKVDGKAVGFDEDPNAKLNLEFEGTLDGVNGKIAARTVWKAFRAVNDKYSPEAASKITGIPAETLVKTAREFFIAKGVCDDGWYSSRNANDVEAFAMMNIINLFTGAFDHAGGCILTVGGGYGGPGIASKGTNHKGPTGVEWSTEPGKPLDKLFFPEGIGTLWSTFDAMKTGKPYPVRALFMTGCAMFHREANSERLIEAFKTLDLIVSQDLMPQESNDWADYVLPSTFFLENHEYIGVNYARDGYVQKSSAEIDPPEGVEARHDIWQFMEILRRIDPDLAKRVGYDKEIRTRDEWKAFWDHGIVDRVWAGFISRKNAAKPGEGDRIAAEVEAKGWAQTNRKVYDRVPYVVPFSSPTGKGELVSFYCLQTPATKGILALPDHFDTPAYTHPKPKSDEFIIASGKNASAGAGCTMFTWPSKFLGDRTLWIHPSDAERLGIEQGDTVEVEGLDNKVKGRTKVTVTNRVMEGVLFFHGFEGGVRTKHLLPEYEWVREGINTQWFATGYSQASCGNMSNNVSVRIRRVN